jgi:hypothetical protein
MQRKKEDSVDVHAHGATLAGNKCAACFGRYLDLLAYGDLLWGLYHEGLDELDRGLALHYFLPVCPHLLSSSRHSDGAV